MKSIEPLVDLWWEDLDLMVSTRDQYWNSIHHCLKYLKSIGVSSTPRKKDLLSYKRALGELGYSATTQNNYITAMRRFFSWAHKSGHISFNPATEIRGIRLNNTFLKDSLTPEKGRELLHSIDPDECITSARDYAICSLM